MIKFLNSFLPVKYQNNRGEVVNEPITPPEPAQPETATPPVEPLSPPPAVSHFDNVMQKKGYKDNDAFAKSYEEVESSYNRSTTALNEAKKQLEGAGYTMDDKGTITPIAQQPQAPYQTPQQPGQYPPQYPPQYQQQQPGQYQPGYQQPQEPIYDPYSGVELTDPLQRQLAMMPVGQREAYIFNAMTQQREKMQGDAFTAETELMNKPEAKGFEQDVKSVMMSLPVEQRANKKNWDDALLRVKGMRYDQAMTDAGQQGVDAFINKTNAQGLPANSAAGASNVKLTPEQDESYKFYQANHPNMFKDKAHFLAMTSPTGGR